MTGKQPPKGTVHGTLRWYVHREHARPTRFGERLGPLTWVVTPIVHGTGSKGLRLGASTVCGTRSRALAFAHKQARRTYKENQS